MMFSLPSIPSHMLTPDLNALLDQMRSVVERYTAVVDGLRPIVDQAKKTGNWAEYDRQNQAGTELGEAFQGLLKQFNVALKAKYDSL